MSCRIRTNMLAGSHYEKPSAASNELEKQMKERLAERDRQDLTLFHPTVVTIQKETNIQKK